MDDGERKRDDIKEKLPREKCLEGLTAKHPLTLPSLLSMPLLYLPCLRSRADSLPFTRTTLTVLPFARASLPKKMGVNMQSNLTF